MDYSEVHMRVTRRFAMTAAALVLAVGAVAGCAATVDGSGAVGSASGSGGPTPSGSGSGSGSGSPTGFPSSGSGPSSSGTQGALASYLVASPSGSQRGSSTWATTTSPTVEAFVQHFYDASQVSEEVSRLRSYGIMDVAHNLWLNRGTQLDVILLRFDSASGALTRHTGIVAATRSDPTLRAATASGSGDLSEFYATKVDKLNNIASRAYAVKGNITLEVFAFTPRTFDQGLLTQYANAQVAKLP